MATTFASRILIALAAVACLGASPAWAQPVRCTGPGFDDFDFWVGEWSLRWTTPDGQEARGANRIRRTHDGCVIVEEFDGGPGSPLKGTSVSVFDPRRKVWRQTWVDNHAGYLDFEGGVSHADGVRMVLARSATLNGQPIRQRMVFRDVTRERLVWDWQRSRDDGATWETTWTLHYTRRSP